MHIGEVMLTVDLVLQPTGREHPHYFFYPDSVLRLTEQHLHAQAVGEYNKGLALLQPRRNKKYAPADIYFRRRIVTLTSHVPPPENITTQNFQKLQRSHLASCGQAECKSGVF